MELLNLKEQNNKKIDWGKLKKNKCPKCWAILSTRNGIKKCIGCGFCIRVGRMKSFFK